MKVTGAQRVFVGFGFGPIQASIFAWEAFRSGRFDRLVIAELDPVLVDAVRAQDGRYTLNVAHADEIKIQEGRDIEMLNPAVAQDRAALQEALREATDLCTSLPSVDFYDRGDESVASLIARGLWAGPPRGSVVYTAENNNHAAEILEEKVTSHLGGYMPHPVSFLNTVIAKMCRVVTDPEEMEAKRLQPLAEGIHRAYLVEAFDTIYVSKSPSIAPTINVFVERDDLFPLEEVKLYGHNAVHALLAFLGAGRGLGGMSELARHEDIMRRARHALLKESGAALQKKYAHHPDPLFTPAGYAAYAEDLLTHITNGYLDDSVERLTRDVERKLGLHDRLFGAMALCLAQGIVPEQFAYGAAAGVLFCMRQQGIDPTSPCADILERIWRDTPSSQATELVELTERAKAELLRDGHLSGSSVE